MNSRSLLPSVLLAAGVLAGTAVSIAWPLAGLVLLAASLFAAVAVHRRHAYVAAAILGGTILLAGAIVALADPKFVPVMMPILGACAMAPLLPNGRICA